MPNIQSNKYTPPPLPNTVATRNKLMLRLDQMAGKKLIFISAPAGSGKTVSAILWMKKSSRKPIWIGLDAYDNSISIFYKLFCAGILSVQTDNEHMTEILQNPAYYSDPVEHAIMLLSAFRADEGEYLLILDDFHVVTNQDTLKSLPYILRRLPHSFTTLILSRNEPDTYLSAYMKNIQAAGIGIDDLSFNTDEICEYFRMLGKKVTAREVKAAFDFTSGWAIAVNILAKSTAHTMVSFVQNALANYFKENIWNEWDDDTRKFLIASAVIDEMPVSLCIRITGKSDAETLLEQLRTQSIFITCIKDGVYRYNPLFLDFLRNQPEYIEMDKKDIWRIAAKYYTNEEDNLVAHHYAYNSGDTDTMLDILDKFMQNGGYFIDEYVKNVRNLPYDQNMGMFCEKCPVLYIFCAYTAFLIGDAKTFEKNTDKLKQRLSEIITDYSRFKEAAFNIITIDYRTSSHYKQADFISPVVFGNGEINAPTKSLHMPFYHRSGRDFCDLTDKEKYDNIKKVYGKLFKNNYEQILHNISTGLFLEQNHVQAALRQAKDSICKLTQYTPKEMRFCAYMYLAAVYLALDKKTELAALLKETEKFINNDAPFLRHNFLAFTTRVKLWDGDTSAAEEWMDYYFVNESKTLEPYRIYQYFTTIRAYAVLGELEKAKDITVRLREMSRDFHRPQGAAEAGVLLSVILWAEGEKEKAQEMMETVLSEMQPYSFIRLIADEGADVLKVLKKIIGKIEHTNYHGLLDTTYVNSVYITAYAISKQRGGITAGLKTKPVNLSGQQKMIVRLLAQGYKRKGIINKTGLSLSTVKSHINIAYRKLGASNAADAVVKARELGIIE